MTTKDFRVQAKALGYDVKKQKNVEVFIVVDNRSSQSCCVTFAELYPVANAAEILAQKLRP